MAFSLYNTVTMGNKNDFLMSHTAFHKKPFSMNQVFKICMSLATFK